jgi:hypothetical protein
MEFAERKQMIKAGMCGQEWSAVKMLRLMV